MERLRKDYEQELHIALIGLCGAGKSSLINDLFSVSRGRTANVVRVHHFSRERDLGTVSASAELDTIPNVVLYDTQEDEDTVSRLQAICEKRPENGGKFSNNPQPVTCVMLVAEAPFILHVKRRYEQNRTEQNIFLQKLMKMSSCIPHDFAMIVVVTKIDRVCPETEKDITYIYTSPMVKDVVDIAAELLDVEPKMVFPVVSFPSATTLKAARYVPILYALYHAKNFAVDRIAYRNADKQTRTDCVGGRK